MHVAVLRPASERLAEEVENDSAQAPEQNERSVGHNGRNEAILWSGPRCDLKEGMKAYPDLILQVVMNLLKP